MEHGGKFDEEMYEFIDVNDLKLLWKINTKTSYEHPETVYKQIRNQKMRNRTRKEW